MGSRRLITIDAICRLDESAPERTRPKKRERHILLDRAEQRYPFPQQHGDGCDRQVTDEAGCEKALNGRSTVDVGPLPAPSIKLGREIGADPVNWHCSVPAPESAETYALTPCFNAEPNCLSM